MRIKRKWLQKERFIVGYAPADVERELSRLHKRDERVKKAIEEERQTFGRLQTEKWAIREELRRQLAEVLDEEDRLLRERERS